MCDKTIFAAHSFRMEEENLHFLLSIDPGYYTHVAEISEAALEGEQRQYAAVQLRKAYSEALETMFLLLGAVAQAPDCPLGWVLSCSTGALYNVVRKLNDDALVMSPWKARPVNWDLLARSIINTRSKDKPWHDRVQSAYARLWRSLACEWENPDFTAEYNTIKHGLRSRMGGYTLAFSIDPAPGERASDLHTFSSSEFGLQFLTKAPLQEGDERNIKFVRVGNNWDPRDFIPRLAFVVTSIHNSLAFLKSRQGAPEDELRLRVPEDPAELEVLLDARRPADRVHWSPNIDPAGVTKWSESEIHKILRKRK